MRDHLDERREMVSDQLAARGISDPRVLQAFLKIPRHLFVREDDVDRAYADHPLAIGHAQTISQPYIVALGLQVLGFLGGEKTLEIGTGSGYQTAVLAELAGSVFTIERIPALARIARSRLDALNYRNVGFRTGDGSLGWPEEAPFDRIVVSAGAPEVPQALVGQLAVGGKMVVPVGSPFRQALTVVTRTEKGMETSDAGGCVFVKLIGQGGWREERPEV